MGVARPRSPHAPRRWRRCPLPAGRCSSPTPATWSPSAGGLSRTASPTSDPSPPRGPCLASASSGPCASPRPPSSDAFGEAGIRCAAAALDIAATATLWACTLDRGRTGAVHMAASAACGAAIAKVATDAARDRRHGALRLLCGGQEMGTRRAGLPACRLSRRGVRHGPPTGRCGPSPSWSRAASYLTAGFRQARQAQGAHGGHVDGCRLHAQPLRGEAAHGAVCHHEREFAEIRRHRRARTVDRGGAGPGRRVHARLRARAVPPPRALPRRRAGPARGRRPPRARNAHARAGQREKRTLPDDLHGASPCPDIQGEVAGLRARRPLALASLCTAALLAAIGCLAATVPAKTAIEESAAGRCPRRRGAKPGDADLRYRRRQRAGARGIPTAARHAPSSSAPSSTAEPTPGAGAVRSYRRRGSHRRDRCRFRGLSLGGVPGAREGAHRARLCRHI